MGSTAKKASSVDKWMTMEEMKTYLSASRESIIQWINTNNMPAHKLGRMWRFKASEVDEWIQTGNAETKDC